MAAVGTNVAKDAGGGSTSSSAAVHAFPAISVGLSSGTLKMNKIGMGWKSGSTGSTESVTGAEIASAHWRVMGRARQLHLALQSGSTLTFDGFRADDEQFLREFMQSAYNVELVIEPAPEVKGWNWLADEPQVDSATGSLVCGTQFSVPQSVLVASSVPERRGRAAGGRQELLLELAPEGDTTGEDGGGDDEAERRARVDTLVAIKLYCPPDDLADDLSNQLTAAAKKLGHAGAAAVGLGGPGGGDGADDDDDDDGEGGAAADAPLAVFQDTLLVTPRGRFAVTVTGRRLKLVGKSRQYSLRTRDIARLFALPKPDGQAVIIILSLEAGVPSTTTYPHVVLQVPRDDKTEAGEPLYKHIVSVLSKAVNQSPTVPGKFRSAGDNYSVEEEVKQEDGSVKVVRREVPSCAIRCSLKAETGHLFLLEQSCFFLFKPPTYIRYDELDHVEFARVGQQGGASTRSFDVLLHLKRGGQHQFMGIATNELEPLVKWFRKKKLRIEAPDGDIDFVGNGDDDAEQSGEGAGSQAEPTRKRSRRAAAAAAEVGIKQELHQASSKKRKTKDDSDGGAAADDDSESDDEDFGAGNADGDGGDDDDDDDDSLEMSEGNSNVESSSSGGGESGGD